MSIQSEGMEPLLVDGKHAAALINVSHRSWQRLVDAGRTPAPLVVGLGGTRRSKRWRLGELQAWVEAGMPDRAEREARRGQQS